jgi:hypothetical protein
MRFALCPMPQNLAWSQKPIEDPDIQIVARSIGPGFVRGFTLSGLSRA